MNTILQPEIDFRLVVLDGGNRVRQLVSEDAMKTYEDVLGRFSHNSIHDDCFRIDGISDQKPVALNFKKHELSSEDVMLVKCFCIHGLCIVQPETCVKYLSNLRYLFEYLSEVNTHVEALSTTRLAMFAGWLDGKAFSAEKKNDIANTVERLIDFMQALGLLRPGLVVFEHRWSVKYKESVKAPERQAMEELDLHFFDLSNDVPSDIRCCYITLRMILSRIGEVLNMKLDAVKYYHDDIYLVNIASYKGQPFGIAREDDYALCRDGEAESIFLQALLMQQAYAESVQDKLSDKQKGLLFASTRKPGHLLADADFNAYLGDVCEQLKLTDATGTPVRLTSHALRHFNIAMRYRDGRFLPWQIQREANHKNEAASMGYYSTSQSEERRRSSAIQAQLTQQAPVKPVEVNEHKYNQLTQSPTMRILPGSGLCSSHECTMQLRRCVNCESFAPDKQYEEAFHEACGLLKERIARGDASSQDKSDLKTYRKFLRRLAIEEGKPHDDG